MRSEDLPKPDASASLHAPSGSGTLAHLRGTSRLRMSLGQAPWRQRSHETRAGVAPTDLLPHSKRPFCPHTTSLSHAISPPRCRVAGSLILELLGADAIAYLRWCAPLLVCLNFCAAGCAAPAPPFADRTCCVAVKIDIAIAAALNSNSNE